MHSTAWLWLALGGCTYVTEAELDAQLQSRDEDGDGVTVGEGDCNDNDPEIYPGRTEVPYDGVDNDCQGNGDLADVDGDGFRASRVGGDDCNDTNADIAPGKPDEPYDGIDADCARDNDFDFDRDGVMALVATPTLVAEYQASSGARFVPIYGDCNDEDPSVFPGSPEEVPYDGIDSDCDGSNDSDADGDGYERDTDCLDLPDDGLAVDPATVFPGAPDVPYDGVDADCAGDNDFDADGDGFVRDEDLDAYQAYEVFYEVSFGARPGDCDDDRSFVNPDGLERLGDLLDQNCDGFEDQASWAFGDFALVEPRTPRVVTVDDGFVVTATVAEVGSPTLPVVANTVLVALFDDELGPFALPLDARTPFGERSGTPGPALGLARMSAGVVMGLATGDGQELTVSLGTLETGTGNLASFSEVSAAIPSPASPVAADVRELEDGLVLATCAGSELFLFTDGGDSALGTLSGASATCFVDADAVASGCGAAGCRSFAASVAPPTLSGPIDDPDPVSMARQREQLRAEVVAGAPGVRIVRPGQPDAQVPSTDAFAQADVVEVDGEWFVAAVTEPVTGPRELRLLWGPSTGSLTTVTLAGFDPQGLGLEPREAAIAANDHRVLVIVTLSNDVDDALAWTVFERT